MTQNAIATPAERCHRYALDVAAGRIKVCRKVRLACERYLADLRRQSDPDYPWRYDAEIANRPGNFIENFLVPTKGDYDSMTLMDWQCFVECNIYGWVHKETGLRRFREALILVGSGNGKSTMMSGNATYGACKDGERGAEIYVLANSKEQAGIVFNECREEIRNSPALSRRFRTLRDGVHYDKMGSTIRARSTDSKRLDGLNPHIAIFDEIHEYRDFKLINVIKKKIIKRRQPLIIYISTMGDVLDGPLVVYYNLFSDALEGKLRADVSDTLFAYIAELDAGDDIEDSSLWCKANPSMGALFQLADLRRDWDRSRLVPTERANFITKQLNIMVNADDAAYVQPEVMNRNNAEISMESLLGRRCYGGFDLSQREDFTAAALEFPLDDGRYFVLLHSWVPRRKVDMDAEKIDYYGLAMRGYLTICDGEYIEQADIYEWFKAQAELYEIVTIGYDPANAVRLRQMLENYGFDCEIVRQGPLTLSDPMKEIKELLVDGRVVSNNDPMLRWYIDNVRISAEKRHASKGNWMPTKANRFRKIDGFMAFLDAHTVQMEKNPAGVIAAAPSVRAISVGYGRQRRNERSVGRR